jgi:hypothetical protein
MYLLCLNIIPSTDNCTSTRTIDEKIICIFCYVYKYYIVYTRVEYSNTILWSSLSTGTKVRCKVLVRVSCILYFPSMYVVPIKLQKYLGNREIFDELFFQKQFLFLNNLSIKTPPYYPKSRVNLPKVESQFTQSRESIYPKSRVNLPKVESQFTQAPSLIYGNMIVHLPIFLKI